MLCSINTGYVNVYGLFLSPLFAYCIEQEQNQKVDQTHTGQKNKRREEVSTGAVKQNSG